MTTTVRPAVVCAPTADDLVFLRRTERVASRQVAGGPLGAYWRVAGWLRRRAGVFTRRAATLLVLLAAAAGFAVVSAPPASAIDLFEPNTWCDRKSFNPQRADAGLLGSFLKNNAENSTAAQDKLPATKWAQYGIQGTEWGTFWLDCFDYKRVVNDAANIVFALARAFSAIAIMIFMWTFRGDMINIFLDGTGANGSTSTLDTMIRQVHIDVYIQLFSVAVLIGATVLAFRFLFKQERGSAMLGKIAAMIMVAGFAFFYGGTPGGSGPHASDIIKPVNDWTNDITGVVLAAFAGTDCETPSIRETANDNYAESEAARNSRRDMSLQCAAEALYEVTIYNPWAVGELGKWEKAPRQADGTAGAKTDSEKVAERILAQQAYSFADIASNAENPDHYKDGRDDPDSDICKKGGEDAKNKATYTGKLCDRATMRQTVMGADDDEFAKAEWGWAHVNATNRMYWENWSGGQSHQRFQIALLALIGSSSLALIIVIVSLAYLLLEITTVMLALAAPLALLIGLIPGMGMKVLLKFTELFLGSFVKRIALGLFVGLLMALYSVVLTVAMPWLMKLVLVCTIAAVGLVYRKKFVDAFSFNFTGETRIKINERTIGGTVAGALGGAAGSKYAGGGYMAGAAGGVAQGMSPQYGQSYMNQVNRQSAYKRKQTDHSVGETQRREQAERRARRTR